MLALSVRKKFHIWWWHHCVLLQIDEELEALLENGEGLYDEKQVVSLCRLMVRVENLEQRLLCLKLIQVWPEWLMPVFILLIFVIIICSTQYMFVLHRILKILHAWSSSWIIMDCRCCGSSWWSFLKRKATVPITSNCSWRWHIYLFIYNSVTFHWSNRDFWNPQRLYSHIHRALCW